MTTTTTQLPSLLRGCVRWRDDRPWVDNDALLIVADWCEENGRTNVATAIREAMAWKGEEAFFDKTPPNDCATPYYGPPKMFRLEWELDPISEFQRTASVAVQRLGNGMAFAGSDVNGRDYGCYRTEQDEVAMLTESGRYLASGAPDPYPPGALQRIRDLARWDLVCHMLGYPPMRLVGEE